MPAHDPLSTLPYFVFERRLVELQKPQHEGGLPYCVEEDFVKLTPKGSKDIVEKKVKDWLTNVEQKVKMEMESPLVLNHFKQSFDAWKSGQEIPVTGTPIAAWPLASLSQQNAMKAIGLRTVEDLANANTEAITRIGMGGQTLKNHAQNFLAAQQDTGPIVMRLDSMQKVMEQQAGVIERLAEENRALRSQLALPQQSAPAVMIQAGPPIISNTPVGQMPESDPTALIGASIDAELAEA